MPKLRKFLLPKFLLLQVRNPGDPQLAGEVGCFARALRCTRDQITPLNLLSHVPSKQDLQRHDVVLVGGSGHYSATADAPWLHRALELFQELHAVAKPTFASCFGFQALARALGGMVVHDIQRAELGTHSVQLTPEGLKDPVFAPLGPIFAAHMGHEDLVVELPRGAQRLARTERVENQAYTFPGLPIYATQFHPELSVDDMIGRVSCYPEYVTRITGLPLDRFSELCTEATAAAEILPRFVNHVLEQ